MERLKVLSTSYYNMAVEYISKGNITRSIELLEKAYNIDSNDIDISNLLGLCYFKSCNFNKSISLWEKSIAVKSENNKANEYIIFIKSDKVTEDINLYNSTLELLKSNDYQVVLNNLNKLSQLDYGWWEVDKVAALIYLKKGENENAYKSIVNALIKNSGDEKSNEYYRYISEKLKKNTLDSSKNQYVKSKSNKKYTVIIASLTILTILTAIATIASVSVLRRSEAEKAVLIQENEKSEAALQEHINLLSNKDNELIALQESLNNVQSKLDSLLNVEIDEDIININELEELQLALGYYERSEYLEAINSLNLVIEYSNDKNMINEALFWVAKSYEKINNTDMAIEKYKTYIDTFKDYNYYDDSLYTLTLILYKMQNIEEAKKYGEILNSECKNSIYNNDIIIDILES